MKSFLLTTMFQLQGLIDKKKCLITRMVTISMARSNPVNVYFKYRNPSPQYILKIQFKIKL